MRTSVIDPCIWKLYHEFCITLSDGLPDIIFCVRLDSRYIFDPGVYLGSTALGCLRNFMDLSLIHVLSCILLHQIVSETPS